VRIVHLIVGLAALGFTGGAALWGIWAWFRDPHGRLFWHLLRIGQAAIVIEAVLGGIYEISHRASELHLIYGLVPIAVSFVAEQLRIASAQTVLDGRGLEDGAAVGRLPKDEQRIVVLSIIQRELGVMVLATIVMTVLLARAAATG
jgi:hypothetical protein